MYLKQLRVLPKPNKWFFISKIENEKLRMENGKIKFGS